MPTDSVESPVLENVKPGGGSTQRRDSEVEYRDVAAGIWRRKYIVLWFVLAGLLCGLLFGVLNKKIYTATTRVELTDVSSHTGSSENQYSSVGDLTSSELLNTEIKT